MSEREEQTAVFLVVNGGYARELLDAAEVLVGGLEVETCETACAEQNAEAQLQVRRQLEQRMGSHQRVLLVTDLMGSTPANVCLQLVRERPDWELIAGVNLAMLLKLATCDRRAAPQELAEKLRNTCLRSVQIGSQLISKKVRRGD